MRRNADVSEVVPDEVGKVVPQQERVLALEVPVNVPEERELLHLWKISLGTAYIGF